MLCHKHFHFQENIFENIFLHFIIIIFFYKLVIYYILCLQINIDVTIHI